MRSRGASPSLGARRCVVLQIPRRASKRSFARSFRSSPDRFFLSFLSYLYFFFYFFSRDSTIAGTGFRCIPSLPLRSEPSPLVRRGARGNDLLFTRFFTRLATATRRRDRRLRVAPELDKILLRENTSAFLPPSSTSPAICFLAHFPVRPPWSFPLLPLRLGDHA